MREGAVAAREDRVVYAVIPVFNRIERTLACVACLKAQTHQPIVIIVSDGGSTDGTPERLATQHPDVIVVRAAKEVWWSGSTRLGIERAFAEGARPTDYVMMVNNDTEFEPDYVRIVLQAALATGGAVGGIVVDENNPDHILDAGVTINWDTAGIHGRHSRPAEPYVPVHTTDALPGRGTLVPVSAIQAAGNVDDVRFPHYIGDYEFTVRLKAKGGIGLFVTHDAVIKTDVPPPRAKPERHPLFESWHIFKDLRSRRSKSNIHDRLNFFDLHAPEDKKPAIRKIIRRGMLRTIASPTYHWLKSHRALGWVVSVFAFLRALGHVLFEPYLILDRDIGDLNLDRLRLGRHQITKPSRFPGFLHAGRPDAYVEKHYPEALGLYRRARHPLRKAWRLVISRIPALGRIASRIRGIITDPYLITDRDIGELGLDRLRLGRHQITKPSRFPGYLHAGRSSAYVAAHYPEARELYARARHPLRKAWRLILSRLPGLRRVVVKLRPIGQRLTMVRRDRVEAAGLSIESLRNEGILVATRHPNWLRFQETRATVAQRVPDAVPLFDRRRRPIAWIEAGFAIGSSKLSRSLKRALRTLSHRVSTLLGPNLVHEDDIVAFGALPETLSDAGVVAASGHAGFYAWRVDRIALLANRPTLVGLFDFSARLGLKGQRWLAFHGIPIAPATPGGPRDAAVFPEDFERLNVNRACCVRAGFLNACHPIADVDYWLASPEAAAHLSPEAARLAEDIADQRQARRRQAKDRAAGSARRGMLVRRSDIVALRYGIDRLIVDGVIEPSGVGEDLYRILDTRHEDALRLGLMALANTGKAG